ncbi:MAG: NUDIX domain-containing protein [Verrucomicrobiaceae bacterium]|nr:MAG: NUDIX domain-containing protein [Verrucomicrobiaceae bacterium]
MSPYYQKLRAALGGELMLIPAVAAMIHDAEGRLLLQEKHDGTWSLPAGAIEPGESPEEAIIREVAEETGLSCVSSSVITVLGGPGFRHVYQNGDRVEYVIVLFRCRVSEVSSPPTDLEETRSIRYFARGEFPGLALPYDVDMLYGIEGTFPENPSEVANVRE